MIVLDIVYIKYKQILCEIVYKNGAKRIVYIKNTKFQ